jgi:hypothetical protein
VGALLKSIPSLSTEPIQVSVSATVNGSAINLTSDTVQFAFTSGVSPGPTDWHNGTWEALSYAGSTVYIAECQIGPGSAVPLAVGTWTVWVKVIDNPDVPVRQVGLLQIT